MSDLSQANVTITGLHHLVLKRSSVSVIWADDPDMRINLPVPFGCALDDIQAEAEKAVRKSSAITAVIKINLPK